MIKKCLKYFFSFGKSLNTYLYTMFLEYPCSSLSLFFIKIFRHSIIKIGHFYEIELFFIKLCPCDAWLKKKYLDNIIKFNKK